MEPKDFGLHNGNPLEPPHGSYGRVAVVDLTAGTTNFEDLTPTMLRTYLGGGALGAHYLLRMVPPGTDALDPGNAMVFTTSLVGGHDVPGAWKHTVLAKSPLTGAVGESQSVGTFAPALKRSGLDAIIVTGRAAKPVYLLVAGGQVSIRDAAGLWGTQVADAHDELLAREGAGVHTAIIGPAGENLVRYASIVNDVRFMNCRTGMGAVMGSKQLKALVIRPLETAPSHAYPDLVDGIWKDWNENSGQAVHNVAQREFGPSSWLSATDGGEDWPYVVGNFDKAVFEQLPALSACILEERHSVEASNQPHTIDYARVYQVTDGPWRTDPRYGGCEGNSIAALGPPLLVDDVKAVLKLSELTYAHGLDPESLGLTLAWVMAGHRDGYLPDDFVPGLQFGDAAAAVDIVGRIARREGDGDVLAEGTARAAGRFGPEAQRNAVTCKGKELPVHEPRNKPALALAYGVGPIGPDYCVVEHDWDYSPDGFPYILKKSHSFGVLTGTPESEHSSQKVSQVVHLQRWWSGALETLMFDLFSVAPARYLPPTHMEQLLRGITGWDITVLEIVRAGERRIALMQEFNRRHGLTRDDDFLPERMYDEPLPDGKHAGTVIDADWYADALGLYYEMSGFDAEGWPLRGKLLELGLGWVWDSRP